MHRKLVLVGIICILMLVAFPTVIAEDEIEFPKENGPYTIFVGGNYYGSLLNPVAIDIFNEYMNLGPLVAIKYPGRLAYNLHKGCILIINGQPQLVNSGFRVEAYGFIGYHPAFFQTIFKLMYFGRLRAFGICQEIDILS